VVRAIPSELDSTRFPACLYTRTFVPSYHAAGLRAKSTSISRGEMNLVIPAKLIQLCNQSLHAILANPFAAGFLPLLHP